MTTIRTQYKRASRHRPGLSICAMIFALAVSVPAHAQDQVLQSCVTDPAVVTARAATTPPDTPLPVALVRTLDTAVREALDGAAASGIIAGVVTPEGSWRGAWGVADPETGAVMEVGMHTRIGSVTKTFTGTALMQLAEAGKLSLEDSIDQYVPGVPNGDVITLRHLANMTSGLPSYTQAEPFLDQFFADPSLHYTPQNLLDFALSGSPIFAPGARFDYSNTNTVLLGLVIEQVTGQDIDTAFNSMILEPLGLTETTGPDGAADLPEPYSQGLTLQGDAATPEAPSNATHWDPSWAWAAGGIISTLDDLLVYGRALGTGKDLLGAEAQQERLRSFPEPAGYGIAMGCVNGWIGHTGELPGYNTTVFYDTTTDTTVVVQANSDIPSGDCGDEDVLPDNPGELACNAPASRVFDALSVALGHPFSMTPTAPAE
ncbi:serine hydrolase domain-containing protein [Roseicitreum antarcticum]|uniref:D-alanyl-D-alanine carboxypeptidase n=1 Tax=Roseicitreum antarcticum TaxID=564137 RepID=A0A1H3FHU8_9RHOB|nr:serine hydrolase domain-containing protein [Roseicitreum antarcticum]SDX90510.1 D-alanyl-D-alanine carboxypeptidase [Roseicitreum antarcticum]